MVVWVFPDACRQFDCEIQGGPTGGEASAETASLEHGPPDTAVANGCRIDRTVAKRLTLRLQQSAKIVYTGVWRLPDGVYRDRMGPLTVQASR